MKKIILLLVLASSQFSFGFEKAENSVVNNNLFIENTREQISYLIELNNQKATQNHWYIYIPGSSLKELKFLINKSNNQFSPNFLKTLNDNLKKVNSALKTKYDYKFN